LNESTAEQQGRGETDGLGGSCDARWITGDIIRVDGGSKL